MIKILNKQNGVTLMEVLLYVVLGTTLLAGIASMYIMVTEGRAKNQTTLEVENQGSFVLHQIAQTIRNADSINSPAASVSSSTLSVNTLTVPNNPTVFNLSGTTIYMTEGAGSPVALTNSQVTVTNLTFTNLSRASTPGVIKISFTLTYLNPTGKSAYDYSRTFYTSAALR